MVEPFQGEDRRIEIKESAIGSAIVSGNGNTVNVINYQKIIHQTFEQRSETLVEEPKGKIGPNPYKGLAAFTESDADQYFGREEQVERLWQRFKALFGQSDQPRLLPILGPSGCGKSSLARAGLIPELARRSLSGKGKMRIAVLMPGTHPVEALAGVLARIITSDLIPIKKAKELKQTLRESNDDGEFDGLRSIATLIPDIQDSPLVLLVDQFEELYSLCKDVKARNIFIENLFHAANSPTGNVSVILTLRSDFLGETHKHPLLNAVIGSDQSIIVPAMTPIELRRAIVEPARFAGMPLGEAVVDLLVKDTQDREGALPLLQFALSRIWEEINKGKNAVDIYWEMEGIGGALAGKAQDIYDKLSDSDKMIARWTFIELVQIGEGTRDTRRRVEIEDLVIPQNTLSRVKHLLHKFSTQEARLITLSSQGKHEVAELTHEALIQNWIQLQKWIDGVRGALLQKRQIEHLAQSWKKQGKVKDYLLQGQALRIAQDFMRSKKNNQEAALSRLAIDFLVRSRMKQQRDLLRSFSLLFIFPMIGMLVLLHYQIINRSTDILSRDDCKADPGIKTMLTYLWWTGNADILRDLKLCNEYLLGLSLPGSTIRNSNFEKANLSNTDFRNSTLVNSRFRGATIAYADFTNALLMKTDFQCSDTKCSELIETNFQNAKLMEAQFKNAFLEGAKFQGADLSYANLEGAKGLTSEQLERATLCHTTLPKYLDISGDRDCL
ncbi:MAG: pentapeptide repeat-containing protein [Cyanobacteria bacterium J06639_14]